jgi:hypothetical protein
MNWEHFQTYNDASTHAFEAMCNQLFELWCRRNYSNDLKSFFVVNGAGGDGGVEAYTVMNDDSIIAVQSKWFRNTIEDSQITQIKNSIKTALKIRPLIKKYIICVPRDLSSDKMGKGKKIVKNTESQKWENLKLDILKVFPTLEIELWNDTKITSELQYTECAGVLRYWFEKSEISHEMVVLSYEKQRSGWLNQRYLPNLHVNGDINERVNYFVGDYKQRKEIYIKLKEFKCNCSNFLNQLNECLLILDSKKINELADKVRFKVNSTIFWIETVIQSIQCDKVLCTDDKNLLSTYDLSDLFKKLEESFKHKNSSDFSDLKKSKTKIIENIHDRSIITVIYQMKQNNLLVLGEPGTGKTHGIANVVKCFNAMKNHVTLLIQAKSIPRNATWHEILTRTLGLSNIWSEGEVWQGLSALSFRNEHRLALENINSIDNIYITPKVLICVDGIDELRPFDIWFDLIGETEAICKQYTRIKFCFTSRSHVFNGFSSDNKMLLNVLNLVSDGDAPVNKMFDAYIKEYGIKLNDNEWLKWCIKTPLALKLFCELYDHKEIEILEKSSVTITNLLEKKIKKLDSEFRSLYSNGFDSNDYVVKKALLKLTKYFYENNIIEKYELIKMFSEIDSLQNTSKQICRDLINYLNDYGLLYCIITHQQSVLEEPKTNYEIGIQPIFDYLYALIIIEKIKTNKFNKLPDNLKSNNGILQMTSIILLNDYDSLLNKYPVFSDNLDYSDLYDLIFFALSNVSPIITEKHRLFIKNFLTQGAFAVKEVTNKVILNVARIDNHPLSPLFLHEFLMEFENVAERDLFWSVPSILAFSNAKWDNTLELNLQEETYILTFEDKYSGLPIVYAWSLTTVDNLKRTYYRKELFKWGVLCPFEFSKLFQLTYQANDPQMKEDLLSIAMGVIFAIPTTHLVIDFFGKWVISEIFSDGKIETNLDAAIRYYARAIAERAYSCGFISLEEVVLCRPPYKVGNEYIKMNVDATKGTVMSGYSPIYYDLSRYVLCDPIERQFFTLPYRYGNIKQYENYKDADKFLIEHAQQLHMDNLKCHQFVLAASYEYLLEIGWNEKEFYGRPNGGNNEDIGVDIAIKRQYYSATHGSKSAVMSFVEKYVWCAKNKILGYLSDRLLFRDDDKLQMVQDYGVLEDFINPAQEFEQSNYEKLIVGKECYYPEELSPVIDGLEKSITENIIEWINNAPIPNFQLWIDIDKRSLTTLLDYDNDFTVLYSYNSQTEESMGVETIMWSTSGLISCYRFEEFLYDLIDQKNEMAHNFMEPERFTSSTESSCYLTPKEICWMTWKKDKYSTVEIYNSESPYELKYEITKAVEGTVCNLDEYGEVYYKLPSKYIRDILKIVDGNGYQYYRKNKELVGTSFEYGEKWIDYQKILCVDKNILQQEIDNKNMRMFWIIRVLREPSNKVKEKFIDFQYSRDSCWIVWKENDKLKFKLFSDEFN